MQSIQTGEILSERRGGVGIVTLNRPAQHNALRYDMWRGLAAALNTFAADAAVRVIIVRGAGQKAFASGADIAEFPERRATLEQGTSYHAAVEEALLALTSAPQPVIAMIHGYCVGGGCEIVTACDLRLSDEFGRFGITPAKLGLVIGIEELRLLRALVGSAVAKDMLFTARLMDATEALRTGLIDRIVPTADLESAVMALADRIASNAPITVTAMKRLLRLLDEGAPHAQIATEHDALTRRAFASDDYAEGIAAFVERRPAKFNGR